MMNKIIIIAKTSQNNRRSDAHFNFLAPIHFNEESLICLAEFFTSFNLLAISWQMFYINLGLDQIN